MFSFKHFTIQKWLLATLFLFTITFVIAYFTGLTGESKRLLLTNSSLLQRAFAAIGVGLVISFIKTDQGETPVQKDPE